MDIMTTAKEEQISLRDEPLPVDLTPLQKVEIVDYVKNACVDNVLTSVVLIDEQIDKLQAAIGPYLTYLGKQREQLLELAQKQGITSDREAVLIEKKGRKERNQIEDIYAFLMQFPQGYEKIREAQKQFLKEKFDETMSTIGHSAIPLGLADDKIGKDAVTEFVGYKPQKITYLVERKKKE
jgi:hypothetical protein